MGSSRTIISTLLTNLESYIDDATVLFESYMEAPEELEARQDIPRARIALYHEAEAEIIKVQAEKPADSRQRYGIDISVLKAYRKDDGSRGELPVLDLRDEVIQWVKGVDAFHVTQGHLHTLGYEGARALLRRKRYVTITMIFSGFRDLAGDTWT